MSALYCVWCGYPIRWYHRKARTYLYVSSKLERTLHKRCAKLADERRARRLPGDTE